MSLNLFIIGPSGCGKTTQAKLIADKYKLTHLSTGQLFRQEISRDTSLGKKIKKFISHGIWVPDKIVVKFICHHLAKINHQDFIIDGTPRTVSQAPLVENCLAKAGQSITGLIYLDVTFAEIARRRAKIGDNFQTGRTDTGSQDIKNRQKEYSRTINPIINYFIKENKLIRVDGNRPIKPIFQDICLKINNLSKKGK